MKDLFKIVSTFRMAIEEAVSAGEIHEMKSFPTGCCSYASDLLHRYLLEQYGIFTLYISGRYGYGWHGESHAWLETQDGTVIDITGDQYRNKELNYTKPVYVGPRVDGFHDRFELDAPTTPIRNEDPFVRNREFDHRYETVIKYLR